MHEVGAANNQQRGRAGAPGGGMVVNDSRVQVQLQRMAPQQQRQQHHQQQQQVTNAIQQNQRHQNPIQHQQVVPVDDGKKSQLFRH